ncbi:hypothetical protein SEA_BILLNYE_236 [Streptomyces phage BillNye]|uniref:Uncharacterized protein n=1 Tax=Streptomyces phage BillNye TaxID=2079426 RepID=A0A2L1IW80_9CAUD|nr:hypothetical protein FDJ30_gp026 [Streptomyces phage BillNye]AVD99422.1 hypothetical protein SEA_BILLNYE_236 [Streptomyces phage BillNye]
MGCVVDLEARFFSSRIGNEHKTAGQRGCSSLKNLEIAWKTLHDLRKRENVRIRLFVSLTKEKRPANIFSLGKEIISLPNETISLANEMTSFALTRESLGTRIISLANQTVLPFFG